jgi:hypothetical protein
VSLVDKGKKLDISTSATRVSCFCSLLRCQMHRRIFEAEPFHSEKFTSYLTLILVYLGYNLLPYCSSLIVPCENTEPVAKTETATGLTRGDKPRLLMSPCRLEAFDQYASVV